jgi:large subunit ribosomal protein L29
MKASELRDLSLGELKQRAGELNSELFNLQFQHSSGQLENPMKLRTVKKDIARALSVIREKELAGAKE